MDKGHKFEYYCANLLRNNDFSNVTVTKGSRDQGVDVVATKDGVRYAVQCKYYSKKVGNSAVQQVFAGKSMYNCQRAVVMTNNLFTPSAKELANANGVLLWDINTLRKMQNRTRQSDQQRRAKPTPPKNSIKLTEFQNESQSKAKSVSSKVEIKSVTSRGKYKFGSIKTLAIFMIVLFVISLFGKFGRGKDIKGKEDDTEKTDVVKTQKVEPTETQEMKITLDDVIYEIMGDYAEVIGVTTAGEESYTLSIYESVRGYTVSSIREKAFEQCKLLEEIAIPNSIEKIGEQAFYDCRNLKKVTIPPNITTIQPYTFARCNSLEYMEIPEGVTTIGRKAFQGCGFYTLSLPSTLLSIESNAFSECRNLKDVTIPPSITNIQPYAFSMCNSLEHMEIPEGVTTVGQGAFENCGFYTLSLPSTLLSIESDAFFSCYNLESVVIPNNVTDIKKRAFKNCRSLSNITLSDSLIEIGDSAFWGCTSLTTMTIPPSVQELDSSLFVYDQSLKTLYIPKSCKIQSGDQPFSGCYNVKDTLLVPEIGFL